MANIKDIAKLAGVSVATVSRALKKPDIVKEDTRNVVLAAIKQLEYKPNALASGLRRRKSEKIIVVVPDIQNPFYASIVQGIEHVAYSNGYKVLLGETQNNQERLDSYADMLMSKEADGLILLGALLPTIVQESIKEKQGIPIPLVMACEYFDGLNAPDVRIDNVGAAANAAGHLIDLGHKVIATITGPLANPLSQDRLKGFKERMRKARLKVHAELVVHGSFSINSGYDAMKKLLEASSRPTAVFCANDEMAIGALKAIKEKGLRVPHDISVIGFDNLRFSEYTDPPLTTISQPNARIGETAMKLMLDLFENIQRIDQTIILPYALIVRASTGKVNGRVA